MSLEVKNSKTLKLLGLILIGIPIPLYFLWVALVWIYILPRSFFVIIDATAVPAMAIITGLTFLGIWLYIYAGLEYGK